MPKTKFKVGDKVMISKESKYYKFDDSFNPAGAIGEVIKVQDEDYSSRLKVRVLWDKDLDISNTYAHEDLVYAEDTKELTVDREFVMAAYESACSSWKKKIEAKFPDLFLNPYAKIVKDETKIATSTLFYLDLNDEYKALEYNIALIDGVAGHGRDIPEEARYRGIYVNNKSKELKLELIETVDGYAIVFKKKA